MEVMVTGTVKWFNRKNGYGCIAPDGGGKDLYFHHSNILMEGFKNMKDGQTVKFEVGERNKVPCAQNVKPVGKTVRKLIVSFLRKIRFYSRKK